VDLVLMDLDGTLVDHDGAEHDAITAWIATAGFPSTVGGVPTEQFWHDLAEEAFVDYRGGRLTFVGQRRQRVSRFLAAVGQDASGMDDADLDGQFDEYLRRYESAWRAFPDARDALRALAQQSRVAVFSNGDHDQQADKMARTGLADLVEAVITSSDLGVAKPHPEAFMQTTSLLGVTPSNTLYCGDRLDVDAQAASAAGLVGVWLNRHGGSQKPIGVHVISTLSELPALAATASRA
jgi:putative hydrolase of the HAD superfamily